ncbi:MAG: CDP-diacylglycerol--glycerol-3-phosphate 3-phosphatidyltransferase [Actinomycetota bacterium]|nr:CDP-diacylglycerol--glycerol-3-phosphate 3-phosphatidyltransferase [Actinomycetota bacterium]
MSRTSAQRDAAHVLNIANGLTVVRILLVPVFAVLLLHGGGHDPWWRAVACGMFVLASVTDLVDGELARRWGQVTDFGAVADPIADKALTGTALVGLSLLGELPWWVTVVILAREVGVTLLRFWVIRHGVIPASRGGKVKTLLQGVAIALYVAPLPSPLHLVASAVMAAAVAVTVVTGADYLVRALRLRRAGAGSDEPAADPRRASVSPRQPAARQHAPVEPAPGAPAPEGEAAARRRADT